MSKTFRPWLVDQPQLLPPSVQDFVPAGHVAHFIREMVREALDLSAILDTYGEARGYQSPTEERAWPVMASWISTGIPAARQESLKVCRKEWKTLRLLTIPASRLNLLNQLE